MKRYFSSLLLTALFITITGVQAMELPAGQKEIVAIAALTANGRIDALKQSLNDGLDAGLTVSEIREVLIQMYAYAGFPRSLNGISAFMEVLSERAGKNIKDAPGREATPMPSGTDRDRLGEAIRNRLSGVETAPPAAGYQLFAPLIDRFLKEHLFADIISRDNLDIQSRELATVAALASMEGLNAQLTYHMNAAMNVGVNEVQMKEAVTVLTAKVGEKEGRNAGEVLNRLLSARNQK